MEFKYKQHQSGKGAEEYQEQYTVSVRGDLAMEICSYFIKDGTNYVLQSIVRHSYKGKLLHFDNREDEIGRYYRTFSLDWEIQDINKKLQVYHERQVKLANELLDKVKVES